MEILEKRDLLELAKNLPDKISFEDYIDRLILLSKIERGRQQVLNGDFIPHTQMKEIVKSWKK